MKKINGTKYGYARVSTAGQDLSAQVEELRQAGASVVYKEHQSGASVNKREEFRALLDTVEAGDEIIVTKLDRFARSTVDALTIAQELLDKGVTLNVLNMGKVDNTPIGRLMLTMMSGFAEFERALIVERMQEGKAYAKANNPNYREGRPRKYSREQLDHAMTLLDDGHTYTQVEGMTGISRSTLTRERRRRRQARSQ